MIGNIHFIIFCIDCCDGSVDVGADILCSIHMLPPVRTAMMGSPLLRSSQRKCLSNGTAPWINDQS